MKVKPNPNCEKRLLSSSIWPLPTFLLPLILRKYKRGLVTRKSFKLLHRHGHSFLPFYFELFYALKGEGKKRKQPPVSEERTKPHLFIFY
jgi:hypothetical protein